MTEDADYPRSLYEVRMDICFKAKVHALHERLYARLDKGVKAIELIASSGAFYAVTAGYTGTTKVCALIVTTFVLLSLVYDFGGRAREMRDMMRNYMQLLSEVDREDVTVASLDRHLALIGRDGPALINGLAKPAYNQNLATHGRYGYALPLSRWERLLQGIA
ncbi:hypothetical protein [Stenotrophomonas sp.]|uniref:hypothetical protein n=1 Tax=Stenotrophomonas sp. TaxID=69392 RepID=UPI0028A7EECC|nr:hypothetical protein [Stenotrophomonas sp.]